jgi:hypothetical protein
MLLVSSMGKVTILNDHKRTAIVLPQHKDPLRITHREPIVISPTGGLPQRVSQGMQLLENPAHAIKNFRYSVAKEEGALNTAYHGFLFLKKTGVPAYIFNSLKDLEDISERIGHATLLLESDETSVTSWDPMTGTQRKLGLEALARGNLVYNLDNLRKGQQYSLLRKNSKAAQHRDRILGIRQPKGLDCLATCLLVATIAGELNDEPNINTEAVASYFGASTNPRVTRIVAHGANKPKFQS